METRNSQARIAVVQFDSRDGEVERNLAIASEYFEESAKAGAQLVLFPEFMSIGYDMSAAIWECAETLEGPTVAWLRESCARHGVYAGTSILETDGRDMLNTFVLAGPEGQVIGTVRKSFPAATEAYRFRGVQGSHVIETPLGRIGVGICYESLFRSWAEGLQRAKPDFVLLSFSAPVPSTSRFNPPENGEAFVQLLDRAPGEIAQRLGVPVAFANKTGRWQSRLPWPLPDEDSYFPGASKIVNGAGAVLESLTDQPGIAVAEIRPGSPGTPSQPLPAGGRWNQPVPAFFSMFRIPECLGRIAYRFSRRRRKLATHRARR